MLAQTTAGVTTKYRYGLERLGSVRGSTTTWEYHDRQGSVRLELTGTGSLNQALRYDAWGQVLSGAPAPFGYTGELRSATTGLEYLRARWYNPATGTLLGRDPFAGDPEQPYSLHPYQYGYSQPTRFSDPSGQCVEPVTFVFCAIGVATVIGGGITWFFEATDGTPGIDVGNVVKGALWGGLHAVPIVGQALTAYEASYAFGTWLKNPTPQTGLNLSLELLAVMCTMGAGGGGGRLIPALAGGGSSGAVALAPALSAVQQGAAGGIAGGFGNHVLHSETGDGSTRDMYVHDNGVGYEPLSKPIKLGHRFTLNNSVPGYDYEKWHEQGIVSLNRGTFWNMFDEAIQNSSEINFNLDGIELDSVSWRNLYNMNTDRYTYQELDRILRDDTLISKTKFYRNSIPLNKKDFTDFVNNWLNLRYK